MIYIDRILTLINQHGLSARAFAIKLGLSPNCVSEWKNGRIKPSLEHIIKIASFFDVTTDYLLGVSDNPKYIENDNSINASYNSLNDIDKEKVKAYINDLLQAQKYSELSQEITITAVAKGEGSSTITKKVTPELMEKIKHLMSDD